MLLNYLQTHIIVEIIRLTQLLEMCHLVNKPDECKISSNTQITWVMFSNSWRDPKTQKVRPLCTWIEPIYHPFCVPWGTFNALFTIFPKQEIHAQNNSRNLDKGPTGFRQFYLPRRFFIIVVLNPWREKGGWVSLPCIHESALGVPLAKWTSSSHNGRRDACIT